MRFTSILYRRVRKYVAADQVGELTKGYSNLPDRYINRVMRQVYHVYPKGPQYTKVDQGKDDNFVFGSERPWEFEFLKRNNPADDRIKRPLIEPIKNWSIFKGDRVEILVGKDKGKQGIVLQIFQEINSVIVEGLNTYLRDMSQGTGQTFVIKQEVPLLVNREVALVDPSDMLGCDVEWRYTEEGDKVRVSKRTGRIIPIPKAAYETVDYKTPTSYKENDTKDTKEADVLAVTFKPSLSTFEMDIMKEQNIEEDRIPVKSFWY
uniref:Large ribosomal subunit protein uL24m n=1 Tax=Cacopsylla melanoneura TaxID=428564 RepID=A0A8D8QXN2_9HEMI